MTPTVTHIIHTHTYIDLASDIAAAKKAVAYTNFSVTYMQAIAIE